MYSYLFLILMPFLCQRSDQGQEPELLQELGEAVIPEQILAAAWCLPGLVG